jgi:tRNA-uridine 2-sulfurtransferase
MKKKVLVGMSGGVDSSTTAFLLKEKGYDVVGATFIISKSEDNFHLADAAKVCENMGIEHHIIDVEDEFKKEVVEYFLQGYENCETPSPCIICNRTVKFKVLLDYADKIGADFVATGHYAQIVEIYGLHYVKKGVSQRKDQSYMLYRVSQEMLKRILFPLGEFEKSYVREISKDADIITYDKPDSQGICFAKEGYFEYLKKHFGDKVKKGEFVTRDGKIMGIHEGYQFYTIGQRRGLGLDIGRAWFVVDIDKDNNKVILGEFEELFRKKIYLKEFILHGNYGMMSEEGFEIIARPRSSSLGNSAFVKMENERLFIEYNEPNMENAPGQHIVFYNGDIVIGGGIIDSRDF